MVLLTHTHAHMPMRLYTHMHLYTHEHRCTHHICIHMKNKISKQKQCLSEQTKHSAAQGKDIRLQGFGKDAYLISLSSDVEFITYEGHLIIEKGLSGHPLAWSEQTILILIFSPWNTGQHSLTVMWKMH